MLDIFLFNHFNSPFIFILAFIFLFFFPLYFYRFSPILKPMPILFNLLLSLLFTTNQYKLVIYIPDPEGFCNYWKNQLWHCKSNNRPILQTPTKTLAHSSSGERQWSPSWWINSPHIRLLAWSWPLCSHWPPVGKHNQSSLSPQAPSTKYGKTE